MHLLTIMAALVAACSPSASATDGELAPDSQSAQVANLVHGYLEQYHYTGARLDDARSQAWLNNYLDALDYGHLVFLQGDVDRARAQYGTQLDEAARSREAVLVPAFELYTLYQARMISRLDDVLAMLDEPIDLTDDEEWNPDRHEKPWPTTDAEAREQWRQRLEEQVLEGDLRGRDRERTVEMLRKRYERMKKSVEDANSNDVMEAWLGALTTSFDPHSWWFSPPDHDNFEIEMSKSLEGIGARLRTIDEYTVVESLVPGGPALRDGALDPGDKIIGVAQGKGEFEDVVDRRIDEVVKVIRGKKGTVVRLQVIPAGEPDSVTEEIDITRDEVILEENRAKAEIQEVAGPDGVVRKLAVINVPSFYQGMTRKSRGEEYQSTTKDVRALLAELEPQGIDGVVLDLRFNGGGSLDEALMLTGLFIPAGPVVQVRDGREEVEVLADPDPELVYDGPLVIATSAWSASASEILAGAIQDYGRGLVVGGKQTHGKGTVQAVIDLNPALTSLLSLRRSTGGGALKITSQMFFRVTGASTQNRGVVPDVLVPSVADYTASFEGDLDHALPWASIQPAQFTRWTGGAADLHLLQQRSQERVADVDTFKWWAEDAAEREAEKGEPVSLHLETRRTEFEARKAKLEARGRDVDAELAAEDEALDSLPDPDAEEVEEDDPVLDEILLITADYVSQLKVPEVADEPAPSKRRGR
ncbi:MAG: carboxyl-terminal processing protease [Myxococcota bacterium]|jgi:carboxyl-terminal processing protease